MLRFVELDVYNCVETIIYQFNNIVLYFFTHKKRCNTVLRLVVVGFVVRLADTGFNVPHSRIANPWYIFIWLLLSFDVLYYYYCYYCDYTHSNYFLSLHLINRVYKLGASYKSCQ